MACLYHLFVDLDYSAKTRSGFHTQLDSRTGIHSLWRIHHLPFLSVSQKLKRQQFRRLLSRTALKEHSDYLQLRNHILAASTHSQELMQLADLIRHDYRFSANDGKIPETSR